MIKSFHAIINFFASDKILIESYYTTDKGGDDTRADSVDILMSKEELSLYKKDPYKIVGIKPTIKSLLKEIHKNDKRRIYDIEEASLTFIAYGDNEHLDEIIFIKPYSVYISFLRNNNVDINLGYGLYGGENTFNIKQNIIS